MIRSDDIVLGEKLGQGTFGVVYQGTWRHNQVAVKELLLSRLSRGSEEEFKQETDIMARLRSPNIVQFYGYCENPYRIVMEYMPKGSLDRVLHDPQENLSWDLRIRIAMDISSGLAFLHCEDILHRDVKSLNVLLNEVYRAKLTDFGLSSIKHESQSSSAAKQSAGTLAWMAPELTTGDEGCTKESDIYSLGITLWELASRELPFKDVAKPALIPLKAAQGKRDKIPLDCPAKLASLIEACWATEPSERPSAEETIVFMRSPEAQTVQSFLLRYRASSTRTGYQGNLRSGSRLSMFELRPALPLPARVVSNPRKPIVPVNPEVVSFLRLIAEGEQQKAEELLKKNRDLVLFPGNVTDLSGRTFESITGFQYAIWALDRHMWTMLLNYLTADEAAGQLQHMGSWVRAYGVHAGLAGGPLENLSAALKRCIDQGEGWSTEQWIEGWNKQVGGAQLLLPIHVIDEYCRTDRSFNPCPTFTESTLPRTSKIGANKWFSVRPEGRLGYHFAFLGKQGLTMAQGETWAKQWADYKTQMELYNRTVIQDVPQEAKRAEQRRKVESLAAELRKNQSWVCPDLYRCPPPGGHSTYNCRECERDTGHYPGTRQLTEQRQLAERVLRDLGSPPSKPTTPLIVDLLKVEWLACTTLMTVRVQDWGRLFSQLGIEQKVAIQQRP